VTAALVAGLSKLILEWLSLKFHHRFLLLVRLVLGSRRLLGGYSRNSRIPFSSVSRLHADQCDPVRQTVSNITSSQSRTLSKELSSRRLSSMPLYTTTTTELSRQRFSEFRRN
jgi:hypothetical protein